MKICTNEGCNEDRPEEFPKIGDTGRRQTQCRSCLTKKAKKRKSYSRPKVRTVEKTDGGLANEFTMMRW